MTSCPVPRQDGGATPALCLSARPARVHAHAAQRAARRSVNRVSKIIVRLRRTIVGATHCRREHDESVPADMIHLLHRTVLQSRGHRRRHGWSASCATRLSSSVRGPMWRLVRRRLRAGQYAQKCAIFELFFMESCSFRERAFGNEPSTGPWICHQIPKSTYRTCCTKSEQGKRMVLLPCY